MRFLEFIYDVSKFFFAMGITFFLFGLSESGLIGENTPIIYMIVGGITSILAVILFFYLNYTGFPIEENND